MAQESNEVANSLLCLFPGPRCHWILAIPRGQAHSGNIDKTPEFPA